MLSTSAEAAPAISSTSCTAWAITGSAPSASVALAVSFMTTKFVIWWTSGLRSRIAARSRPAFMPPPSGRGRRPGPRPRRARDGPARPPARPPRCSPAASSRLSPRASSAASVAECVQPAPCVAATSCRATRISTWRVPSKRWSTGSPCPPVTITAGAPSSCSRSASSRFEPVPTRTSASARFGVTTVASGKRRATSVSTASSSSSRAPELAIITGSTTSGTGCSLEEAGDGLDHAARRTASPSWRHPRRDRRRPLRAEPARRQAAPRAPRSHRRCSAPSARRSRSCRGSPAAAKAFRSAWMPAPPPESDPAIVRHLGINCLPSPA